MKDVQGGLYCIPRLLLQINILESMAQLAATTDHGCLSLGSKGILVRRDQGEGFLRLQPTCFGTMPVFTWSNEGKLQKTSVSIADPK